MIVHEASDGPLFTDPSCDRAREHFRGKRYGLVDKMMTVAEAARRLVPDGIYPLRGYCALQKCLTGVLQTARR
jgi:hypothetical protein